MMESPFRDGPAAAAGGGKCVKWRGNSKSFILKFGTKNGGKKAHILVMPPDE